MAYRNVKDREERPSGRTGRSSLGISKTSRENTGKRYNSFRYDGSSKKIDLFIKQHK